jgi:hypothetical protein
MDASNKLSEPKLTFAKRGFRAIRLIDFPTGKAGPLAKEQEGWLVEAAYAIPPDRDFHVYLVGYASKLGFSHENQGASDQSNVNLSYRRANAVAQILELINPRATSRIDSFEAKGSGDYSGQASDNSPEWRAVEVHIFLDSAPPPPSNIEPLPPPPKPGKPPGSLNWRMRVFRDAGASIVVVEGDAVVFQIVDDDRGQCGLCYYLGAGIAIAAKIPTSPGSIASAGSFEGFTTSRRVYLEDFEGEAELSISPGVAVGSLSLGGTLYFSPLGKRLLALPGTRKTVLNESPLALTSGNGFSVGLGSSSSGKLSAPAVFGPGDCCKAPGGVCTRFK